MDHTNYILEANVLIIDDEPKLRKLLQIGFENYGAKVTMAHNGKEGIEFAYTHRPNLIVLDLNLGDMHGQDVLLEIRKNIKCPLIILTVENATETIIKLLGLGADDYLTKPFDINLLLARAQATLRRSLKEELPSITYQKNGLMVNFEKRTIELNEIEIKLTKTEFDLLKLFIKNAGKVLTYREILKEIWGPSMIEHHQYPRVYVRHLRSKIEIDPDNPKFILTEPGLGYRFLG